MLEREFPHADVSFLNNPYDSYYVTVTAVVGNSTSTPAPEDGITFSYYQDSQVEQKCEYVSACDTCEVTKVKLINDLFPCHKHYYWIIVDWLMSKEPIFSLCTHPILYLCTMEGNSSSEAEQPRELKVHKLIITEFHTDVMV